MNPEMNPLRKKAVKLANAIMSSCDDVDLEGLFITDLDFRAQTLSLILDATLSKEGECEQLMWEWTQDHYWGSKVKRDIPKFLELYNHCVDNGHNSRNNATWYGDMDVGVWYVPQKDGRKILIMRNICTCRDDNTYVYIYENFMEDREGDTGEYVRFLSTNVYDRQKSWKNKPFGDYRDIVKPSLATLKRYGYKDFGYLDGRDKEHNFKYEGRDNKVDSSSWNSGRIKQSLQELDFAHNNIVIQEGGFDL